MRVFFFVIILLFRFNYCLCGQERVIVVSPHLSVQDKFKVLSHVKTINEAMNLIAHEKDSSLVRIVLDGGIHYLDSTVIIGNMKRNIIIESRDNAEKVELTSGKLIVQNLKCNDDIVSFPCGKNVSKLLVNGEDRPICGSSQCPSLMKQFSSFARGVGNNTYTAIFDLDEVEKMEVGCYIYIYCKWINYKLKVLKIDYETGKVTMGGMWVKVDYVVNDKNTYYSIHNSRSLLKPGTFCCIGEKIYYKLKGNENANLINIRVPFLTSLVKIYNCSKGVILRGVHFSNVIIDNLLTQESQASVDLPFVIDITQSENVEINKCEFSNNMGYSIGLRSNSFDCLIKDCYLHDLQGGGIMIGNHTRSDTTHDILITGNLIKSFGKINASSVGILVTKAHNIVITNNTICDGYYSGISLGWTWGYGKSYSYGNYIANNHIHHLMQGVLSDGAGIYTLGKQEGTIIENNYIHDVVSRVFSSAGSSLLYFDEGSSNIIARNNVCMGSHTGFHEHYGKCNRVENNIFAYTNLTALRLSNAKKDSLLTISNNIIINDCGTAYNATLAQNAILKDNRSLIGKVIDKEAGVKKAEGIESGLKGLFIQNLGIEQFFAKGLLKNKFSYGVTSGYLKEKARLSVDYLNKQNRMVTENFSPCSSYFKRVYK